MDLVAGDVFLDWDGKDRGVGGPVRAVVGVGSLHNGSFVVVVDGIVQRKNNNNNNN